MYTIPTEAFPLSPNKNANKKSNCTFSRLLLHFFFTHDKSKDFFLCSLLDFDWKKGSLSREVFSEVKGLNLIYKLDWKTLQKCQSSKFGCSISIELLFIYFRTRLPSFKLSKGEFVHIDFMADKISPLCCTYSFDCEPKRIDDTLGFINLLYHALYSSKLSRVFWNSSD
jgi:hypothetical protein